MDSKKGVKKTLSSSPPKKPSILDDIDLEDSFDDFFERDVKYDTLSLQTKKIIKNPNFVKKSGSFGTLEPVTEVKSKWGVLRDSKEARKKILETGKRKSDPAVAIPKTAAQYTRPITSGVGLPKLPGGGGEPIVIKLAQTNLPQIGKTKSTNSLHTSC